MKLVLNKLKIILDLGRFLSILILMRKAVL